MRWTTRYQKKVGNIKSDDVVDDRTFEKPPEDKFEIIRVPANGRRKGKSGKGLDSSDYIKKKRKARKLDKLIIKNVTMLLKMSEKVEDEVMDDSEQFCRSIVEELAATALCKSLEMDEVKKVPPLIIKPIKVKKSKKHRRKNREESGQPLPLPKIRIKDLINMKSEEKVAPQEVPKSKEKAKAKKKVEKVTQIKSLRLQLQEVRKIGRNGQN